MSSNVTWVRSSACNADACVEVAAIGDKVHVRDSHGNEHPFSTTGWRYVLHMARDASVGWVQAFFVRHGLFFTEAEIVEFQAGADRGEFALDALAVSS